MAALVSLWEYQGIVPDWDTQLTNRTAVFLNDLRRNPKKSYSIAPDSRELHRRLFAGLTPPGLGHLAGNYRGEPQPPLDTCRVIFDGIEGAPPHLVAEKMAALKVEVLAGINELDVIPREGSMSDLDFEKSLVTFACAVFCDFLRIHPYVNGNGHAARCVAWALLGRYGYWPRSWTIHPRLPDPKYTELIRAYRSGQREQLERFVQEDLLRQAVVKK